MPSALADAVLPLIRTRADLHRWSAANAHGAQMHEAADLLEDAADSDTDPAEALDVTRRAIDSSLKILMRADDSSGIIGNAIGRLLELHADFAYRARPPASRLVDWMIKVTFVEGGGMFEADPALYAEALGEAGLARYRDKIDQIAATPGRSEDFHVGWAYRRLAVAQRDIDQIIRLHVRDRKVAAWLQDTAEALEWVGEHELALDFARQGVDFGHGHQSQEAARYWLDLLAKRRPDRVEEAAVYVFRRWPTASWAARLHKIAVMNNTWDLYSEEVTAALTASPLGPREVVIFTLHSLEDVPTAWRLAHDLNLTSADVWEDLVAAYERTDPIAVIPVQQDLVEAELQEAGAAHYKRAARRLRHLRTTLKRHGDALDDVDHWITDLRTRHKNRPRLQTEFDRAGLPR